MSLSIIQIAEAFSRHEFEKTYSYLRGTVEWNLVGNQQINGYENVIKSCGQSADYLVGITTTFSQFTVIVGDTHVVIDSLAEYGDDQQKRTCISSCDIYEFIGGKLAKITSYSVDVSC